MLLTLCSYKHIAVEFGGSFVTKFTVIDLFSGAGGLSKGFFGCQDIM